MTDVLAAVEEAAHAHPISLWRNRDYLLLWSGQAVSTLGSGVSGLAFPLLVLASMNKHVRSAQSNPTNLPA